MVVYLVSLGWFVGDVDAARRVKFGVKAPDKQALQEREIAWRPASGTQAQTWIFWGWNDKGYMVTTLVIVTRFLFVSRVGVQLTIHEPNGKTTYRVKEYTLDKFSARKDRLSMLINKAHRFEGGLTKGSFQVSFGKWGCSLSYKRVLPGFRLLGGPMKFRRKIYEGITFAPRTVLKGSILINGKSVPFRGFGYADYSLQTIIPKRLARRWFVMRAMNRDMTLLFGHLRTHKRWRPSDLPTFSIARKRKWVFQGTPRTVSFRARGYRRDPVSGYRIPKRVIVTAKADNGVRYKLDIRQKKQIVNINLMGHINPVLRFLLNRLLSRPFVYRYRADVTLTTTQKGKKQTERLTGYTEWMFVQ
jgi:hypothetical protein